MNLPKPLITAVEPPIKSGWKGHINGSVENTSTPTQRYALQKQRGFTMSELALGLVILASPLAFLAYKHHERQETKLSSRFVVQGLEGTNVTLRLFEQTYSVALKDPEGLKKPFFGDTVVIGLRPNGDASMCNVYATTEPCYELSLKPGDPLHVLLESSKTFAQIEADFALSDAKDRFPSK